MIDPRLADVNTEEHLSLDARSFVVNFVPQTGSVDCLALPGDACLMLICQLQEIRRVWIGYMSQADAKLGQRLASKLQQTASL